MCIVPMEQVQTRIDESWWQPLGMRSSVSYRVNFSGVELRGTDLIGQPDEYHREPWFSGGAIRFAAVQLGGAEALLDMTRDYVRSLRRADDPYQRHRVGQMAILLAAGDNWLAGAARMNESTAAAETIVAYANMMRLAIEQICLDCMRLAERAIGARGLIKPHPMERVVRDLTMYLRQPNPDGALANVGAYVLEHTQPAHEVWR